MKCLQSINYNIKLEIYEYPPSFFTLLFSLLFDVVVFFAIYFYSKIIIVSSAWLFRFIFPFIRFSFSAVIVVVAVVAFLVLFLLLLLFSFYSFFLCLSFRCVYCAKVYRIVGWYFFLLLSLLKMFVQYSQFWKLIIVSPLNLPHLYTQC